MNRNTIRQHYVQTALTTSWEKNGLVDVALKVDNTSFIQEKSKPARSLFYEDFMYEQVHGFESAKGHLKNNTILRTDNNHVFRMNDGEYYCKEIEDHGLPIIRRIVRQAKQGNRRATLSAEECIMLDKYLVLQTLRTPAARESFMFEKSPQFIRTDADNGDAIAKYIENVTYQFMIGMHDEAGLSDNYETPVSFFKHLLGIIAGMSGYLLVANNPKEEFVLGDNPCVLLGMDEGISALLMPLDPKVAVLLCADDSPPHTDYLDIGACSKAWLDMAYYTQVNAAKEKIVFNDECITISDIENFISARPENRLNLDIWTVRRMVEYLQEKNDGFDIDKYIK